MQGGHARRMGMGAAHRPLKVLTPKMLNTSVEHLRFIERLRLTTREILIFIQPENAQS